MGKQFQIQMGMQILTATLSPFVNPPILGRRRFFIQIYLIPRLLQLMHRPDVRLK